VPTGNDDATDEGATEGTMLTGGVTTFEDGISEIVPLGGIVATDGEGTTTTGEGATNAVVPTNGVDTNEFIITGIWPVTAAVGTTEPDTDGVAWVWINYEVTLGIIRVDICPSNPVDTMGGTKSWGGYRVVAGAKLLLLNCCGLPNVGRLALALTTDTVVVSLSVDTQ